MWYCQQQNPVAPTEVAATPAVTPVAVVVHDLWTQNEFAQGVPAALALAARMPGALAAAPFGGVHGGAIGRGAWAVSCCCCCIC